MTDPTRDDDVDADLLARERGEDGATAPGSEMARYDQLKSLLAGLPAIPEGAPESDWSDRVLATIDAEAAAGPSAQPSAPQSPVAQPFTARPVAEQPPSEQPPAEQPSSGQPPSGRLPSGQPSAAQPSSASPSGESRPARRHRPWWQWPTLAAAGVAAAAAGVLLVPWGRDPSNEDTLAVEVERSSVPRLTSDVGVGDTLIVRAAANAGAELRVYDDGGAQVARCFDPGPGCAVERDGGRVRLRLAMPLRTPGRLRPVLFSAPLEESSRGLDEDVAAAVRANLTVKTHEPIWVR